MPGASIRSQQKRAIGRGADRVRDLRTQHTTIDNERAISLCGTPKEIDSRVCQRAAIDRQNRSQLIRSIQKDRTGIALAKAAVGGRTLKRVRKINRVVENKIA